MKKQSCRLVSLLLSAALVFSSLLVLPSVALAEGTTEDGFSWVGDGSGGVSITRYQGSQTAVVIPGQINSLPVTMLGDGAFEGCTALESIVIPASVNMIGLAPFRGCTSLTSIDVAEGGSHFVSQQGVLYISDLTVLLAYPGGKAGPFNVPEGTAVIAAEAFAGSAVTAVTLPGSVRSIEEGAFAGCAALAAATLPSTMESIGERAFAGCTALSDLIIGGSGLSIGSRAFYGCTSLVDLTLDGYINYIGDEAFAGIGMHRVHFMGSAPDSVGQNIFGGAAADFIVVYEPGTSGWSNPWNGYPTQAGLISNGFMWALNDTGVTIRSYQGSAANVVVPAQIEGRPVTAIGTSAFYQKAFIRTIQLPASLAEIGDQAFYDCDGLVSFAVAGGSTHFTVQDGVLYNAGKTTLVAYPPARQQSSLAVPATVTRIGPFSLRNSRALETVTLPAGLTSVGNSAFFGCSRLKNVTLPSSLRILEDEAFRGCALESVTLPAGVTAIGFGTFAESPSLAAVTLPAGLTTIGDFAFYTTGITAISIPASVTNIGPGVFSDCPDLAVITVAAGNAKYRSEGGVLFDAGKTTLICYPSSKASATYAVPETVTRIGRADDGRIFQDCKALTGIYIPVSVTEINSSFSGCSNITAFDVAAGNPAYVSVGGVLYTKDMARMVAYPGGSAATTYTVPATVTELSTFNAAGHLTAFAVAPGNPVYKARDGILYTFYEDPNTLSMIAFPPGKAMDNIVVPPTVPAPETVLGVEPGAFSGSLHLKSVTLRDGQTSLPSHLLSFCYSVERVDIPDSVTRIGLDCFYNCHNLRELTIPASVTEIEGEAFQGADALEHITFEGAGAQQLTLAPSKTEAGGDVLSVIPYGAFSDCASLEDIALPGTIEEIGGAAFSGCVSLQSIEIDAGSDHYSSVGGVLYSGDMTTLIQYPAKRPGTSFTVPSTVTAIAADAFADVANLTALTIPASVVRIDNLAFSAGAGERLTIYGTAGSYAQTFAAGMGIPFSTQAPTPQNCTVTFNSQGGSAVASKTVSYNTAVAAPPAPTRSGYTFGGWYKESSCKNAWNFSTKVTGNITLWAKWTAQTASANLSGIKLSTGSLSPAFKANVTSYTVNLSETAGSVTVTPAKAYGSATMTIDGKTAASKTVSVANGKSVTMTVKLTYAKLSKIYKLVIKRPKSTNNNLASLKVSAGTLSPAFRATVTSYKLILPEGTSKVTITGAKASSLATITSAKKTYTLKNGQSVTAMVKVKSQAGAVKTYKITIMRPKSTNNNLSSLKVSAGKLSPAFKAGVTSYTLTLPEGTSKVTVTGVKASSLATITSAKKTYTLKNGQTVMATVAVKSQAGVTKTYKITITRAKSTKATLASLKTSSTKYPLAPAFKSGTLAYKVTLPTTAPSVTLTWKLSDPLAKATVGGKAASAYTVSLASGQSKTVTVVVAAQAGNTKTYVITVSRK